MPSLNLTLNGDGCWPDMAGKFIRHVSSPIEIAGLNGGMESGDPSVSIRIDLADGSVVLAETSLRLFLTAADALRARYGDPRK